MDQVGEVSPIVQDHVEGLPLFEVDGLFNAPDVLLIRFTFPRKYYRDRRERTERKHPGDDANEQK